MSDDELRRGLIEAARKLQVLRRENDELRARLGTPRIESSFASAQATPPQTPIDDGAPHLTRSQRWMWLLDRMAPDSALYHVAVGLRITGPLDLDVLQAAIDDVLAAHEGLRLSIDDEHGEPVAVINDRAHLPLRRADLTSIAPERRDEALAALRSSFSHEPIRLDSAPCGRALVVTLAADEHLLLFVWHHLIIDGASAGLLFRFVLAAYAQRVAGQPVALPVPEWRPRDYARWETNSLDAARQHELRTYWTDSLRSVRPLELPMDRRAPALADHAGDTLRFALPPLLSRAIKGLALEHGCTPYVVLTTAIGILLHRYTGQDDFGVASVVSNRRHAAARDIIACFVNTVMLRIDAAHGPTVSELIARTRAVVAGALAHEEYPFDELMALGSVPHARVSVVMETIATPPVAPPLHVDADAETLGGDVPDTAKFDLSFAFAEIAGRYHAALAFRTSVFDRSTIERMATHLRTLLEAMATDPRQPIALLPLLGAVELEQLAQWNATARPRDEATSLHRMFEAQAARRPDAPAVTHGAQSLTYRELDARASAIADDLLRRGIEREDRVGVAVARSVDLVATLLGVLKAGAAYVPLDPAYPVERLRFMIADSRCRYVIATDTETLAQTIPGGSDALISIGALGTIATVGTPSDGIAHLDIPRPDLAPSNLAYLIYTSGSTGTPKAVAIEHRSAVEMVRWAHESFDADDLSAVLAATSVCFDLSVFELFAPLTMGGRVIIARDALELAELGDEAGVRLLNTVPSAAEELLRLGGIPSTVRTINLAGEPLRATLVDALYASTSAVNVNDLYGPSEDTTYSTWTRRDAHGPETIGGPVSNTRAYVLDAHDRLVPIGVLGQLHLAGDGLARGYFERDALTAERFVPDPFGAPGDRMYRTGDLVRRRADGRLEYLGRIDQQVKLRGFRIELGEIEAAMRAYPHVLDCAAFIEGIGSADARLVVAVVPSDGRDDTHAWRAHLATTLPSHMIPQRFAIIDALPRTANGKLDRRALAKLATSAASVPSPTMRPVDEPRDSLERSIAAIWSEALGRAAIGRADHFFELGGHSLLASRVAARVGDIVGRKVPVVTLFQFPVLHALATHLRASAVEAVPVERPRPDAAVARQVAGIRGFARRAQTPHRGADPVKTDD